MQALSSEDLSVAICAVYLLQQQRLVSSGSLARLMRLSAQDCQAAILRLSTARVMRGRAVPSDRWGAQDELWVSSVAVVRLLKAVEYLFPVPTLGDPLAALGHGIPTGYAAPAFRGQTVFRRALVWACSPEAGGEYGVLVEPMFPGLPEVVAPLLLPEVPLDGTERQDAQDLYTIFSGIDMLREGRAREIGLAVETLRELLAISGRMWMAA